VYLVEPEPVVEMAARAAAAMGLGDRIVVLQKRIQDVSIEPVDLLISVCTGNLLFSEDLLPVLFHARDRWLKPGGQMVPDRAQLWLAPVAAPQLHARHIARWSTPVQGMDFSVGRSHAAARVLTLARADAQGCQPMGEAVAGTDLDLRSATDASCAVRLQVTATHTGPCHGIAAWTRLRLGEDWLGTGLQDPPVHWSPCLLPFDPPVQVREGEALQLSLSRPAFGEWTWSIACESATQRQSTFLSAPVRRSSFRNSMPGTAPGLSAAGRQQLLALDQLKRGATNLEAARTLSSEWQMLEDEALAFVLRCARQFGDDE
jgi:hypothetical protein